MVSESEGWDASWRPPRMMSDVYRVHVWNRVNGNVKARVWCLMFCTSWFVQRPRVPFEFNSLACHFSFSNIIFELVEFLLAFSRGLISYHNTEFRAFIRPPAPLAKCDTRSIISSWCNKRIVERYLLFFTHWLR